MKKYLLLIPVLALVATVMMTPGPVKADAAVHVAVSDLYPGEVCSGVVTFSGNGNLSCKMDVPPPASGHAERYDSTSPAYLGLLCSAPPFDNTDWTITVSATGKWSLTCKAH